MIEANTPFQYAFKTLYAKELFHGNYRKEYPNLIAFAVHTRGVIVGAKRGCTDAKLLLKKINETFSSLDSKFEQFESDLNHRIMKCGQMGKVNRDGSVVDVMLSKKPILQYWDFIERFDDFAFTWLSYIALRPEQKSHMYGAFRLWRNPLRKAFMLPSGYHLDEECFPPNSLKQAKNKYNVSPFRNLS